MMTATVSAENTAWLYVKILGPNTLEADIPCVIDTGFSEQLALPRSWITALALPEVGYDDVIVADGRQVLVTVHEGKSSGMGRSVLFSSIAWKAMRWSVWR